MVIFLKRKFFKLNIDDVMEIVSEYLATSEGFECFSTNTKIVEENGKWYMVIAIGNLEDKGIDYINMEELSQKIEYNGNHGEDYWKSDKELKEAINKFNKNNNK